ncbi:MAG: hypothetical protein D6717_08235 [Gammaproteobacteria bacterium]|nr:MAG: hypothetical protein D6717_08235 [Gammaproteobacteria bacterium]
MDRKLLYRSLMKIMVLLALTFIFYAFLEDWLAQQQTEERDHAVVDVTMLEPGAEMRVRWDGKGYLILHRTPQMIRHLRSHEEGLLDPYSERSLQPEWAQNPLRSARPEYLVVMVPSFPGQGECPLRYQPPGPDGAGRLMAECNGAAYDLAGRAISGTAARGNLVVPEYHWQTPVQLVILR